MIQAGKLNTKFGICTEVRRLLLENEAVTELVGTKIYPILAPEGTKGNFITYTRSNYTINETKMGIYEQDCDVAIACVAESYDKSIEIADAVFKALHGYYAIHRGNIVMNSISLVDSSEDWVDDVYIQYLQFRIG